MASGPRSGPHGRSRPCRCRFSASSSARRISTMLRYRSRSAAASRPRWLLASGVSSPACEKRARTGSSVATTRTTSAIAGNIVYPVVSRESRPTTTYTVAQSDRERLRQALNGMGGVERPPGPHEAWRVRLSDGSSQTVAILYRSGKLVVAGHAPAFDQVVAPAETMGERVAQKPQPGGAAASPGIEAPSENEPHIGTDEAGKGDFFGPLVTAGVYVDEKMAKLLRALGVRDSKLVGDRELRVLASNVREVVDEQRRALIVLAPKRYNV